MNLPSIWSVARRLMARSWIASSADHGVSWQTDTEVAGEHLAEIGGSSLLHELRQAAARRQSRRTCDHILEVGHGSVLEHAVWNFVFTGVSAARLTHELVRHRAGWAYSQLSQRYVDESVAEYVEPDVIADDPELHALWLEAVPTPTRPTCSWWRSWPRSSRTSRTRRCGASWPARRPAVCCPTPPRRRSSSRPTPGPCGTSSSMRASRHAEVEIRKLAVKVLEIMQAEAPHLFGDYQLVPLPDGTLEAVTPHRKV